MARAWRLGNIKYLFIESEINSQPLIELFTAIGIAPDQAAKLRKTNKRGEAVQDFRTRYLEIKEQCDQVQVRLASISLQHRDVIDVDGLSAKHEILKNLSLKDFDEVRSPADLRKIVYSKEQLRTIAEAAQMLQKLVTLYEVYNSQIKTELEYALKVKQVLREYPGFIHLYCLEEMLNDALAILANADTLLDAAGRQPLLGKLQQVRKKYQAAYYKEHERCVGSKVDWNRLQSVIDDPTYKNLLVLKNVRILDKRLFANVENGIINASNLRCDNFRLEMLENEALCPRCRFPSNYGVEFNQRLDAIEKRIADSWKDWESTILTEVNNYKDNIQYLQKDEKQEISYILKNGTLPEVITNTLVKALNHLFDELEIVELSAKQLMEYLFKDSQVLDYYSLERNLNEFKQMLVAGKDLEKVRIKQAEQEGE